MCDPRSARLEHTAEACSSTTHPDTTTKGGFYGESVTWDSKPQVLSPSLRYTSVYQDEIVLKLLNARSHPDRIRVAY